MSLHSGSVFCDGSSRKRARQTSETRLEDPTPWEYHPTYGVVHLAGCSVCDAYTTHLVEAERQSSFQLALKDRDHKHDLYFFDGVSEGRRRQRDDNEYLYEERERYRNERNEALEEMSRYKTECHSIRVELRLLTNQLNSTQDECATLRRSLEITNKNQKVDQAHRSSTMDGMEMDAMPSCPQDSSPRYNPTPTPTLISPTDPNLDEPSPGRPQSSSASRGHSTYAAAASSQHSVTPTAMTTSKQPKFSLLDHRVANLPARPNATLSHIDSRLTTTEFASGHQAARNPRTIGQLQSLMIAAHKPGNDGALAKIKALCAEAHSTPREHKTELQKYLLSNWRNPNLFTESARTAPLVPAKMNPRMDDPVETWFAYLSTHQGSWPRGVRRDSRNRPFVSDLKASRTVARLRPDVDTAATVASRSEFLTCVTELFSTPGVYKKYIEQNSLTIAPAASYRPYPGFAPITLEAVIRHFADCGVTVEAAAEEFEPWSRSYLAAIPTALNGSRANERGTSSGYDNDR
jgi:hypothetical protein